MEDAGARTAGRTGIGGGGYSSTTSTKNRYRQCTRHKGATAVAGTVVELCVRSEQGRDAELCSRFSCTYRSAERDQFLRSERFNDDGRAMGDARFAQYPLSPDPLPLPRLC